MRITRNKIVSRIEMRASGRVATAEVFVPELPAPGQYLKAAVQIPMLEGRAERHALRNAEEMVGNGLDYLEHHCETSADYLAALARQEADPAVS